ncbi:enhanced serine sensitivity protein SseB [Acerihabitans arboris]|uniref:Enhanced serine sensitivity protein SseB n=1 Tax=Acerihabitans arboris TaxID=2691583 RepID=A0A845SSQ1_9GAMM|nr:enhanced serine sensitivity protein SseB [Acerihabitans arboris]NDL65738.1 enhanced serine sensitivity protein SseB [Acerihabitans arboris]
MNPSLDNALEQALKLAADEPAHRPAFFNLLLESTVYVLGDAGDGWIAGAARHDGEQPVNLQHWEKPDGTTAIPFFTSLAALQQAVSQTQPFLALPTRALFAMTAGAELFLNPKLPYGNAFSADEITALMMNEGDALTEREILEGEMRITLSSPEQQPMQMIDSLTRLFADIKQVRRAFIVQVQDNPQEKPHWLIGLECEGDEEKIVRAVGRVATDTAPDEEPVDICLVGQDEPGISHYFTQHITPFYERKWGSWLRTLRDNGVH